MNAKALRQGLSNFLPHIPCCVLPMLLKFGGVSAMSGIFGVLHNPILAAAIFLFLPPVAVFIDNAIHNNKVRKKQKHHYHCKDDCEHDQIRCNNPLKKQWWRENKNSLIIGYSIQAAAIMGDYLLHGHSGLSDLDHHHHGHWHDHSHDALHEAFQETEEALVPQEVHNGQEIQTSEDVPNDYSAQTSNEHQSLDAMDCDHDSHDHKHPHGEHGKALEVAKKDTTARAFGLHRLQPKFMP